MKIAASTRSGWSAASGVIQFAAHDSPASTAVLVSVASITASASATNSCSR